MAMRLGRRICSHVRINNFSGVPTSLRGRSFSGPLSQVVESSAVSGSALAASTFGIWGVWFYHYDVLCCRTLVENMLADLKIQEMEKRLNREKFQSKDAYAEMLDREVNRLQEKLSERKIGVLDMMVYDREVDALKAKIETRLANENNTPEAA